MSNDTDLPKSAMERPDTRFDAGSRPSSAGTPATRASGTATAIAAAAARRAAVRGEDTAVARLVDVEAAVDVLGGKVEFEHGEEGREWDILEYLLRNAGRVLTRGQLIDRIWGADYVGDTKTLDVHIKRLRTKIEHDPENPEIILTVRGVGYKTGKSEV